LAEVELEEAAEVAMPELPAEQVESKLDRFFEARNKQIVEE